MTPVSWVHEWWRQEDYSTNKDEGQQVCKKIAEIDALWRMSSGEKAADDRLKEIHSTAKTDPTQTIEDAFRGDTPVVVGASFRGCRIVTPRP